MELKTSSQRLLKHKYKIMKKKRKRNRFPGS